MANNFKNHLTANINNFANVGGFAVKEGQVATIIGLSLANMNNVAVTADVQINQGIGPAGNITIVKAAPIPVGGALVNDKVLFVTLYDLVVDVSDGY